ncbi:M1 family metallopeptidase [Candidatus Saccharibacteria bacterium]|nr:M1 family metallopeptidase [Candidatus Saccharibacteria bacterium]
MTKQVRRLYKYFRPQNYKLELQPDGDKMTFSGRVVIIGKKTGPPSKRLTFHQSNLKISSAEITKFDKKGLREFSISRINTHQKFNELRLHTSDLLYGGHYKIEVSFSGKITDQMHGLYPCYFAGRKKKIIATQFESHHAREVFPCIDEPQAKATFDLCLTTPKGETVLANTPIKEQRTMNNEQITTFETTPIMSSYLLAFVYGELVYKEAKTKNGIVIRSYATPGSKKLLDFSVDIGARSVDFFEDYFYTPYPLTKLDMVALPEFSSGAMENWGLITYRESILLVDPKKTSIESKQLTALVVTHEIAHMWFGNLVTMEWWDDLWLNESFANVMEYRAVDALFPEWRIWEQFINTEMHAAMARDSLPNVQAVRCKVNHPDEIGPLFDPAIVYAKGGNILSMMRHMIGEENFRQGLKDYFQRYEYSNTVADDLWKSLGEASALDVNNFMHQWLNFPGFPVVDVRYTPGKKSFTASQKRLSIGKSSNSRDVLWPIPLATDTSTTTPLLRKSSEQFDFETIPENPIFNRDGHSYYVPHYLDPQHFSVLLHMVAKKKLSPIDRLQLVQNYNLMERAGIVSTIENLELTGAYKSEDDEAVWSAIATTLASARRLVKGDEAAEANLNNFVAGLVKALVKKVGWKARAGESAQSLRRRNLILTIGASAEMPEILKEAKKLFAKFNKPVDLPADTRSVVYYVAARFGPPADFKKLLKLYKSIDNADEKDEIASALCSTRDLNNLKLLLSMITTDDVRLQNVISWFIWLLRNYEARPLTWQWLIDNWAWIDKYFGTDKYYDFFPRSAASTFSTTQELSMYKKFFGPKIVIRALERTIKLGLEEMEGRIEWRVKNEQPVKKWLTTYKSARS